MIEKLDYAEVPHNFVHCFREDCPLAGSCLRQQALRFLPEEERTVRAVAPHVATAKDDCSEYLSDTPVRYAYGMSRLFDNIPYGKAKNVKADVVYLIGKTQFYRMRKKEIGISPKHQRLIRKTFKAYGVTEEPVFDSYKEHFQWYKE